MQLSWWAEQVAELRFSSEQQATACVRAVNDSLAALLPLLAQLAGPRAKLMGGGLESCQLHCVEALGRLVADGQLVQRGMLYAHEPSGLMCDRYLFIVPKELQLRATNFWEQYDSNRALHSAGVAGSGIVRDHKARQAAWRGLSAADRAVAWRACSESTAGVLGGALQRRAHYRGLLSVHPAGASAADV